MANKIINLEGYGKIVFSPITLKKKELPKVGLNGEEIKWVKGTSTRGHYEDLEGNEIPSSHIRRKIEIDGETILIPKFKPTEAVKSKDIEVSDSNEEIYTALERKEYNAFTDSDVLKKLIIDEKKSLKFPLVVGHGEIMYNGVLTSWKGKMGLFGCLGNLDKGFEAFDDDAVDIEVSTVPLDKRKLMQAMEA